MQVWEVSGHIRPLPPKMDNVFDTFDMPVLRASNLVLPGVVDLVYLGLQLCCDAGHLTPAPDEIGPISGRTVH